ncbi:MAG: ABC transporter permease [Flavobacterium sp.]|nr:ABC transporter permease [Candidatus Neoflavobacterium equi]
MNMLSLIIKREFLTKVRNKSFIVMTLLGPILILGMSLLIGFLSNMNAGEVKHIGIHDASSIFVSKFESNKEVKYINLSAMPLEQAKDTATKTMKALLYIPKVADLNDLNEKLEYISDDSPSMETIMEVENVINTEITHQNLEKMGLNVADIDKAKGNASLKLSKFSGEDSLKGINEIKIAIGSVFGYLIMMFIIIYGNFVMRSVIEEKTSRIIEIIISSVKPYQLMMGKIIGNSLAGILQFFIWGICGAILFFGVNYFFGVQPNSVDPEMIQTAQNEFGSQISLYLTEILKFPLATLLISFVIYFIGGYFLYSSMYAAIGAAVDSETDSQQFLMPIIMPLMLGVYVGFFTVINDPHGTVATVFSFIPFTSPIVMLMRIPFGVPLWQIVLSMALLMGTFFLVVWFASKIYRIGVLSYGKKPTWKELYKWLKY